MLACGNRSNRSNTYNVQKNTSIFSEGYSRCCAYCAGLLLT